MTTFALAMLVLVLANDVMLLMLPGKPPHWPVFPDRTFCSHARKPAVRTLPDHLGGLAFGSRRSDDCYHRHHCITETCL